MTTVLPIVEGEGDLLAVPMLVRRIAQAHGRHDVTVIRPHLRGDMPTVDGQFERVLGAALLEHCPVLWVLDYDCSTCNDLARDETRWRKRGARQTGNNRLEFAFMVKEFETLFLADEKTARKVFPDIPSHLAFPDHPESIRDAKGWLKQARPKGQTYKPTVHQAKLTAQIDLKHLRRASPSFQRFEEAVLRLIAL